MTTNNDARCDKFGDFGDGRHVMDVENADLNLAELRLKLAALIESHADVEFVSQTHDEIVMRLAKKS
jgi:hypothetical protein